jgi:hypothetical protein
MVEKPVAAAIEIEKRIILSIDPSLHAIFKQVLITVQAFVVCLVAHEVGVSSMGGDFLKCQTFAASPAEPGDLPCWVSMRLDRLPGDQAAGASPEHRSFHPLATVLRSGRFADIGPPFMLGDTQPTFTGCPSYRGKWLRRRNLPKPRIQLFRPFEAPPFRFFGLSSSRLYPRLRNSLVC